MSKTIGVMLGLLNMIILFFFVIQFDEKALLKYGERARKMTECARNSFVFWFSPTWIITLKSSVSFNIKEKSFEVIFEKKYCVFLCQLVKEWERNGIVNPLQIKVFLQYNYN